MVLPIGISISPESLRNMTIVSVLFVCFFGFLFRFLLGPDVRRKKAARARMIVTNFKHDSCIFEIKRTRPIANWSNDMNK